MPQRLRHDHDRWLLELMVLLALVPLVAALAVVLGWYGLPVTLDWIAWSAWAAL